MPTSEVAKETTKEPMETGASENAATSTSPEKPETSKLLRRSRNLIRAEKTDASLVKTVSDYIIPILVLIIFALIIAFVYVPFGTEILKVKESADKLRDQISKDEAKIATLKRINLSELDGNIETVSKFIKNEMDVSALAKEVETIASSNGLTIVNASMSNTASIKSATSDTSIRPDLPQYAGLISGPFSFEGTFEQIMNFIKALRTQSSTLLSFRVVDITKGSNTASEKTTAQLRQDWSISIYIDGYITPAITKVGINDPVNLNINQTLLNQIKDKVNGSQATTPSTTTPSSTENTTTQP